MRKNEIFCIIICICLRVVAFASASTQSYAPFTVYNVDHYLGSLATYDNNLFLIRDKGLYQLSSGEKDETLLMIDWKNEPSAIENVDEIHQLISANDGLYGFDQVTKTLYRCEVEGETVLPHKVYALPEDMNRRIRSSFLLDGLFICDMGEDIYAYNIATGEVFKQTAFNVILIAAYEDRQYIALERRMSADGNATLFVMVVNPLNGVKEKLGTVSGTLNIQAAAYDHDSHIIYLACSDRIYAWKDGIAKEVATFPPGDVMSFTLINQDFAAACVDGEFLAIRSLNQDQALANAGKRLVIQEEHGRGSTYAEFIRQHGDIELQFAQEPATTVEEKFIQDMLNQSDEVDIYVLADQGLLYDIKEKQYGADLSKSALIRQKVDEMFPYIINAIYDDGKIYAIPRLIFLPSLAYNKEIFAELSLPVPSTYQEYFEFCIRWIEEYAGEYPDYALNPCLEDLEPISLLRMYADEMDQNDIPLVFTGEPLRTTLDAYIRLESVAINQNDTIIDGIKLFSYVYIPYEGEYERLPLTFKMGNQPAISPRKDEFYYFVVNPYSKHQDEAIALVESWITALPPQQNLILFSTVNAAVTNPEYEEVLKKYEDKIQEEEKKRSTAEPIEAKELEYSIARLKEDQEWTREHERWLISPIEITLRDRDIASASLHTSNPIAILEKHHPTFFQFYMSGAQLDIDALLSRLDEINKQIYIENQ